MTTFGVVITPAVACLRDGKAIEVVARMRDWSIYAQACERLLAPVDAAATRDIGGHA
jgi:hypothetical protein